MKTTSLIFAVAILLALPSIMSAVEQSKETKSNVVTKEKKPKADEQGKIVLTGSHIKQDIKRNGRITDGPAQVLVLDRSSIERSGASDLRQLLVHTGIR
jgi:hypothetical protein